MATKNMHNPKKRLHRLFFVLPAVAIFVCIVLAGLELTHVTNFIHRSPTPAPTGPTPEQKKQEAATAAQQKEDAIENPPETTPSSPSTVEATPISFTAHQESNGTVTIITNLGSIGDGSCTLDITNGAKTTSQTATVIYQPQYSTCAGFSVPVSGLGTGSWTLKLSVTSQGTTVSKTVSQEIR